MKLIKGPSDVQNRDDWFKFAPPKKGALQWKDGRSAKELAIAWCTKANCPSPPDEFLQLLKPLVGPDQLADAVGYPERQIPIDDLRGEPPNIDLAIVSDGIKGLTAICIEAKADEPFGRYVSEMLDINCSPAQPRHLPWRNCTMRRSRSSLFTSSCLLAT